MIRGRSFGVACVSMSCPCIQRKATSRGIPSMPMHLHLTATAKDCRTSSWDAPAHQMPNQIAEEGAKRSVNSK